MEHLGRAQRRTRIADQGVRHGAEALFAAEEMRRGVRGVADEAHGIDLALGAGGADRRGVGHHLGHLLARAVARVHGQEGRHRHVGAHRPGIVGRDAGRAQLLQEDRLEIHEMEERAGDVHHRFAGADPLALVVALVDLDIGLPIGRHLPQPVDREPGREHHGPAHEDGIGHAGVAELADHLLRSIEVVIGVLLDLAVSRMRHRPSPGSRSGRAGQVAGRALCTDRRSAFSCSASRNASSSAWLALSRGSHCVS